MSQGAAHRVWLEIGIGDPEAHAAKQQRFEATSRFFDENKAQLGLPESAMLSGLDAESQELLADSFRTREPDAAEVLLAAPAPLCAGRVIIELAKEAPKAAQNFRCLCTGERGKGRKSGKLLHYAGVPMHRIVSGFVCQGGDIVTGDGSGGDSIYGGSFNDEKPALKLKHDAAGVVSMANSGKNSNMSQFFITLAPAPQCDGRHVVLGRVVEGLDIVKRIGEEAASADGKPRVPVTILACGQL